MAHAGKKFDLEQMQNYFEAEARNIRCISDYQLSEADYKSLGVKLKALFNFESNCDWMQEFILPLTIFVVYSYIYDMPELFGDFTYGDVSSRLSQYQLRRHVQNMLNCIHDFGLLDFGYGKYDFTTACRMTVARHAGIPNDEKYLVFDLLSKYRDVMDFNDYLEELYEKLPPKTCRVFGILDEASRHDILFGIRNLMESCREAGSRSKILEQYPGLSITLIDYCIFWSENQRMMMRMGS